VDDFQKKGEKNKKDVRSYDTARGKISDQYLSSDESKVEAIVVDTRKRILELEKIDIKFGHNLGSFEKANNYLQEAMEHLRKLEV
jgi:hypothetical protein